LGKHLDWNMLRWFLVGTVTVGIDWFVFVNVYPRVGSVAVSNFISGSVATSFNYFAHLESGSRYLLALLFGYVLNTALLKSFIVAGVVAALAKAMASAIQAPISYFVLNFFVFKKAK
jgi:putative flippase GtrA